MTPAASPGAWNRGFPGALRGNTALPTPQFQPLASRAWREHVSVVLSHPVRGTLFQQPWDQYSCGVVREAARASGPSQQDLLSLTSAIQATLLGAETQKTWLSSSLRAPVGGPSSRTPSLPSSYTQAARSSSRSTSVPGSAPPPRPRLPRASVIRWKEQRATGVQETQERTGFS